MQNFQDDDCIRITRRVELILNPDACNAATCTETGLLVPRTAVAGIAPGGNIGDTRSVDIDVTETGDCPDTWTVGARLTPVYGQIAGSDLTLPLNSQWTATNCVATLPEPGAYRVTAMGWGQICAIAENSTNVWVTLGLQLDGVGVLVSQVVTQHQYGFPGGPGYQSCHLGQGSITWDVTIAGPANVRVMGAASGLVGPGSTLQGAWLRQPLISWDKIAD